MGSVGREEGRRRELRSEQGDGGHGCRGGSSPVAWGGGERAQELLWGERVPFPGSIGAGEGRRWELDGAGTAGSHGCRPSLRRRAPTSALPRLQLTPGTEPSRPREAPEPAHRRPKLPASCRRGTHGRRRPAHCGAPSSGLPRAQPTPQLAPSRSAGAPRPARRRPSPPERRRRRPSPPAATPLRGAALSGHPSSNQSHPEVELILLLLFPHRALAADEPKRRNPATTASSVSNPSQGPRVEIQESPGGYLNRQ